MASYFSRPSTTMPSSPSQNGQTSEPQSQQSQTQEQQTQSLQPAHKPQLSNSAKLLIGGTAFLILSTFITRRTLRRKRLTSLPPTYTSAPYHKPQVNGALEALEALNIATINVASVAMIGVGACMYAFDINTMDDLRRKVRGGLGVDGSGRSEQVVEEELEEWVARVFSRKAEKEKRSEGGRQQDANEKGKER
ncbi:hypothetical protein GX48_04771 [Paracoccidioides brasiliensis]|nr:hypothetical protein GX48_04771 [Paracoccidioides brasiliensis]